MFGWITGALAVPVLLTILSGGVTSDKKFVKKAEVVVDAGAVDAGPSAKDLAIATRRATFKMHLDNLVVMWSARGTVSVKKLMWSTANVSETMDSVMVILNTPEGEVGLFFTFSEGRWKTFPDDFK